MSKQKQHVKSATMGLTGKLAAARKVEAKAIAARIAAMLNKEAPVDDSARKAKEAFKAGTEALRGEVKSMLEQKEARAEEAFRQAKALADATSWLRSHPEATGVRVESGGQWYSFTVDMSPEGKRFALPLND